MHKVFASLELRTLPSPCIADDAEQEHYSEAYSHRLPVGTEDSSFREDALNAGRVRTLHGPDILLKLVANALKPGPIGKKIAKPSRISVVGCDGTVAPRRRHIRANRPLTTSRSLQFGRQQPAQIELG